MFAFTALFLMHSAVILLVAGCGCREDSPDSARQNLPEAPKIAPREAPSGDAGKQAENASGGNEGEPRRREIDPMNLEEGADVVTYDTGDWDAWPSYDLPVVFEFEVPALPEGFSEPSPPIPDE